MSKTNNTVKPIESTDLFSPENSDMGFLMWIHERLEHVHGESPLMDYMHKLRAIIADGSKRNGEKSTSHELNHDRKGSMPS